jgi:hypothetical protein
MIPVGPAGARSRRALLARRPVGSVISRILEMGP